MTTIVVGGAIANKPGNGGEAWVRLSWAEGLRHLGFDVWLVEQIDPASCVDTTGRRVPFERSVNRSYFEDVMQAFGWAGRSALVCTDETRRCAGADWATVTAAVAGADLLVNISGHLREPALVEGPRVRAYIDIDPGFTQIWNDQGVDLGLERHDLFFTIGVNIGRPGCPIPTGGLQWRPVLQPVVLAEWPVMPLPDSQPFRFTTVGTLRGPYGPVEHDGRSYGVKVQEFRKLAPLPPARRCPLRGRTADPPGRRGRPRAPRAQRLAPGRPPGVAGAR